MCKITFIVLTYNSSKHIEKLLESLLIKFGNEIKSGKAEIIVVDNDSKDDTVKKLKDYRSRIKNLKIVESGSNSGFAAGINLGVKNSDGEYLVFINPDAEYQKGNIFDAVSAFDKDKKIGIIGGAIKTYEGKMEKSAGKFIRTFEVLSLLLGLDEAMGVRMSPAKKTEVDFVSGGFMIVPKKLFTEIGGFDEDFFMYIEDMELCFRVNKSGYKVVFNPEVEIMHAGQGSSSRGFAVRNIFRGLLIFQKKHGNALSYMLIKVILTVKASLLVLAGKMLNNRYLVETYEKAI